MKIGQLVRIINASHPWAGHHAVIVDEIHGVVLAGRRWVIRLDGSGTESRAGDRDLQVIPRPSAQLNLEGDIVARGP